VDTEVTKLIATLRSISNLLEARYGRKANEQQPNSGASIGIQNGATQFGSIPDTVQGIDGQGSEIQATPVYQLVHQLPMVNDAGQQLVHADNADVPRPKDVVTGTFDSMPMLLQTSSEGTPIQPEVISDKDRIKQLEQELARATRQNNVNFNFAPVNIGGTNGQSSN
jgi:hypothetical protein